MGVRIFHVRLGRASHHAKAVTAAAVGPPPQMTGPDLPPPTSLTPGDPYSIVHRRAGTVRSSIPRAPVAPSPPANYLLPCRPSLHAPTSNSERAYLPRSLVSSCYS